MESKDIIKRSKFEDTIGRYEEIIKNSEAIIRENEKNIRKCKELIRKNINGRIGIYCIDADNYYDMVSEQFSQHNIETFKCSFDDVKDSENNDEKSWDVLLILVNHNIPTHDITTTVNKLLTDTNLYVDSNGHHIVKIMLTEYANNNMY